MNETTTLPAAGAETEAVAPGVPRLRPDTTTIFAGVASVLHCQVKGKGLFRGVFALRLFPVRHPDRFISLHYTDLDDKDVEIGLIENLGDFPAEQQELVKRDLQAHYHEEIITRIHEVEYNFGLLFFAIDTQRGRKDFVMPWRGDRAEDYGDRGKVLLDAFDNRYIIPDVEALPAADRRRFQCYIYW